MKKKKMKAFQIYYLTNYVLIFLDAFTIIINDINCHLTSKIHKKTNNYENIIENNTKLINE